MKKILKSKSGVGYLWVCVIILFAVLLIFALMQYMYIYHVVRQQKNFVQVELDGYVTRYAMSSYDALKQGESYEDHLDRQGLVDGAYSLLGFTRIVTLEYCEMIGQRVVYTMSRPEIYSLTGGSFGVYIKYTLTVPFEMFGRKIADIQIPVEMVSKYTEK